LAIPGSVSLYFDHYHDRRQLVAHVVELCGKDVSVVGFADHATSAVSAVERFAANVALIEMQLPTALDTIRAPSAEHPNHRIVVCSFLNDRQTRQIAQARGADAYLAKPISPGDLDPHLRAPPARPVDTVQR
jgi:DNA-binding NarL/FixJ family response regulator